MREEQQTSGGDEAADLAAEVAAIRAELRAIFDPKAETGKGGC